MKYESHKELSPDDSMYPLYMKERSLVNPQNMQKIYTDTPNLPSKPYIHKKPRNMQKQAQLTEPAPVKPFIPSMYDPTKKIAQRQEPVQKKPEKFALTRPSNYQESKYKINGFKDIDLDNDLNLRSSPEFENRMYNPERLFSDEYGKNSIGFEQHIVRQQSDIKESSYDRDLDNKYSVLIDDLKKENKRLRELNNEFSNSLENKRELELMLQQYKAELDAVKAEYSKRDNTITRELENRIKVLTEEKQELTMILEQQRHEIGELKQIIEKNQKNVVRDRTDLQNQIDELKRMLEHREQKEAYNSKINILSEEYPGYTKTPPRKSLQPQVQAKNVNPIPYYNKLEQSEYYGGDDGFYNTTQLNRPDTVKRGQKFSLTRNSSNTSTSLLRQEQQYSTPRAYQSRRIVLPGVNESRRVRSIGRNPLYNQINTYSRDYSRNRF